MNKRPLAVTLAVTMLVVLAASVYMGLGARPNLGLDLQGGIEAIYSPSLPEGAEVPDDFADIVDETIEIIRSRIDALGVAEPEISRSGTDDPLILVQLPGITDEERVRELIGTTAQLTFRPVLDVLPPQVASSLEGAIDCSLPIDERELPGDDEEGLLCGAVDDGTPVDPETGEPRPTIYLVGPTALSGERISDAFPSLGQGTQAYEVTLDLDSQGASEFAAITSELACARDQGQPGMLGIVLDAEVVYAPVMQTSIACGIGITGGTATITTGAGLSPTEQQQEAEDLALILRAGALPISLDAPESFETVSPTLGEESLRSGLLAGFLGLALVSLWLVFFYRSLGVVALLGLGIFGVVMMSIISLLGIVGFALTLAGVAGIIVSIGITADSSIIYFERIRDEVNLGKTVRTGATRAFASAFRTNLAGNTVTLTAAAILYFLAVGPVRGFALMLGIATVIDIVILYFFTRPVVGLMAGTRLLDRRMVRAAKPASSTTGGAA